jgi:signal peptidase I
MTRFIMGTFVVRGKSMEPGFREGDLVLTHKIKRPPVPGDVIIYRHPEDGFLIVHRVTRSVGEIVWAAGDSNSDPDPHAVSVHKIVGKVWIVLPRVGRFVQFLRKGALP